MASAASLRIHEPGPRQFINELRGQRAFEHGEALALHRPLELHLQLTSGCNLDCYMCHEHLRPVEARHGKGMKFLDRAVLERIEREVLPYSLRLHLGVGGEPMLAPFFLELVERAHAKNQRIHLTTNGTRIATERVAEVLAHCVHEIEISIDGATAATYERIRGGASFARLVKNIELLNKHRFLRDAEDRPRLSLCMVLMRSNVHELPRLVELAATLKVDAVSAWPVIPVTAEGRADALDLEAARPFVVEARERAKALGIALDLPFDHGALDDGVPREDRSAALRRLAKLEGLDRERGTSRHYCHMPTVAVYVLWDGRVYPCANPKTHQGDALGNLASQEFSDIWNGRSFRNLRAGLAAGDVPEVCRTCAILHRSAGPVEASRSDLVQWFGERDLAPLTPAATGASDLIELAVASGFADQVHERHFKLLGYSQLLEREVHQQASDNERLLHERVAARLHIEALLVEREHLKAHANVLARDREGLSGHSTTLEAANGALEAHARNLETEREALISGVRALEAEVHRTESEIERLRHASESARLERDALLEERIHQSDHAQTLARERRALGLHAMTLESEREQLVRHAANLERILERTRARALYRTLSNLKDFLQRPRPRTPFAYVPPWEADGSRRAGEPPARLE
ncbi:MAG TPA: radical SAM protein [Planctomycetota bacterium]|nr:radical SAM protein [Planctomycetota bacterium]